MVRNSIRIPELSGDIEENTELLLDEAREYIKLAERLEAQNRAAQSESEEE